MDSIVSKASTVNSKNTWNDNLAAMFEAKLKAAIDNRGGGGGNDNFQTLFFSKYKSQNAHFFASDRSKTVGTKQEILSNSKILMYFYKKHEFLANVCQLAKKCSLLRTLLSPFKV